eukprot:TRINITY_DN1533_c0_g1_i6.p1 TRINITY_DN1533_c0_g1~~TRINITY_DN1533_c0_g1_i6.p1  ORF type:complete len:174 (+),score=18.03 TRINITY_DN1533_c0_g1_i6:346-867(+)
MCKTIQYWAEAVMCATYLLNRLPTVAILGMTPFEASKKLVFIGYTEGRKAYKLYDPLNGAVQYARSVVFDEANFHHASSATVENAHFDAEDPVSSFDFSESVHLRRGSRIRRPPELYSPPDFCHSRDGGASNYPLVAEQLIASGCLRLSTTNLESLLDIRLDLLLGDSLKKKG